MKILDFENIHLDEYNNNLYNLSLYIKMIKVCKVNSAECQTCHLIRDKREYDF